jgi:hypothetical protein
MRAEETGPHRDPRGVIGVVVVVHRAHGAQLRPVPADHVGLLQSPRIVDVNHISLMGPLRTNLAAPSAVVCRRHEGGHRETTGTNITAT